MAFGVMHPLRIDPFFSLRRSSAEQNIKASPTIFVAQSTFVNFFYM
jgi:hypothetical protein